MQILIQNSLSSIGLILAIWGLRALFLQKLPKRTFCVLWGIAVLYLWLPFSVPCVCSIYHWLAALRPKTAPALQMHAPVWGAPALPLTTITGTPQTTSQPLWPYVVWGIGVCVCLLYFAIV